MEGVTNPTSLGLGSGPLYNWSLRHGAKGENKRLATGSRFDRLKRRAPQIRAFVTLPEERLIDRDTEHSEKPAPAEMGASIGIKGTQCKTNSPCEYVCPLSVVVGE